MTSLRCEVEQKLGCALSVAIDRGREREGRTSGDPGQFCPNHDPLIYNGYREDECSRVSDDENDFAPENLGLECGSLLVHVERSAASSVGDMFCSLATASVLALAARPITGPWPAAFPAKELCSNCGLCGSATGVASVVEACAFLGEGMGRAERLEAAVHGRVRRYTENDLAEAHFGVHETITLARVMQKN